MPLMMAGLRWQVLRALERAQEDVARGHPSLEVALHYLRLSEQAWAEVDRALDAVRFEVPTEQLESVALTEGGKSAEGVRLREALKAAHQNARIPWVSKEGHTRVQCVCLLFIARELVKRLPLASQQELFSTERR